VAVAIEFGSAGAAIASGSVATIAGLDFNAEASDRIIAVSLALEFASTSITGVTIGGVTADPLVQATDATGGRTAEIWSAEVPTGTSGDVVVTLSANNPAVGAATFSVTGADPTPTDTDEATGSGVSISISGLTIPSGGQGLSGYCNGTGTTEIAWTGASESHDDSVSGAGSFRHSSAIVTTEGTNTITADGATNNQALVGVAWGPAAGAVTHSIDLDPASFAYTPSDLGVPVTRALELSSASFAYTANDLTPAVTRSLELSPASFAYSANDLTVSLTVTGQAQQGPADDRPARRRRDQQVREAYWAQRQREALEEEERKRLEALAEAERALERAEDAKRADAKRKAVRAVFDALRRAAVSAKAKEDAQRAEQAALEVIARRQTEEHRAAYMAALDQLHTEIEAIGAEITRLYARRRQEEEFLLRMWAA